METEKNLKILHLTLKKRWFDMIASGEKKEEYRELKHYWKNRFHGVSKSGTGRNDDSFRHFDYIHFSNGYNRPRTINVKFDGVDIGTGKQEWGAVPGKMYFVIKLGEII